MIKVDLSKCVGCNSCSNVCPSQNIMREDTADGKRIHWKRCKEECDLCVEFCPAKALMLVPFDEASEEPDASFDLVACKICGARYATEPMLKRIDSVLPVNLQEDSTGLSLDLGLPYLSPKYRGGACNQADGAGEEQKESMRLIHFSSRDLSMHYFRSISSLRSRFWVFK